LEALNINIGVYAGVASVMSLVGLMALLPAVPASNVDPVKALRSE
jgi:ABC-type antimicrobial peptide transport system permease subunit